MKKSLFSFSLVFCMIAGLLGGAVTAGAAQNSQLIIEGKIEKISTIYAGEIFVSGKSQMKYLYSDDISYHYAVFANLKEALKDTAFYDLVPTVAQNAPSSTGVAISSSHQEDMGVDWKSATTVARHYYSGTPGSETNVNMYDYSASYKKEVETLQSGFLSDYNNLSEDSFGKGVPSILYISSGEPRWVDEDGTKVKKNVVVVNFETANVIYTSINVTSATGNGDSSHTDSDVKSLETGNVKSTDEETNSGEVKTGTEETRPVEEKITISKKPAIKKLKAAKGRITVSWNKFKTKGKKNKATWKKIKNIEVQCSTKKNFPTDETKKKTIRKTKKSMKFTGLKKKTTYFVRVRYCDGARGYSKWSAIKKVKTK